VGEILNGKIYFGASFGMNYSFETKDTGEAVIADIKLLLIQHTIKLIEMKQAVIKDELNFQILDFMDPTSSLGHSLLFWGVTIIFDNNNFVANANYPFVTKLLPFFLGLLYYS